MYLTGEDIHSMIVFFIDGSLLMLPNFDHNRESNKVFEFLYWEKQYNLVYNLEFSYSHKWHYQKCVIYLLIK